MVSDQCDILNPLHHSYVAGKTIYFGVGGGILPFCNAIDGAKDEAGHKLKHESVFETSGENTVKREILKITWDI
jgi:protein-histidine N-methyltransferase